VLVLSSSAFPSSCHGDGRFDDVVNNNNMLTVNESILLRRLFFFLKNEVKQMMVCL
jgi:hypothetical protein